MLAPTPLDVALGRAELTQIVQSFMGPGLHARRLTSRFMAGREIELLDGQHAVWDEVTGRRHLAGFSAPASPHVAVGETGKVTRTTALAHIKLHKDIPAARLYSQRAPGMVTPSGQTVIRQELRDLFNMILDTVERSCGLVLSTGKLTASAANFPGTKATFDIDFGAADNLAFTRSAPWATPTTKIMSNDAVLKIAKAYTDGTGVEPGEVIFNYTVLAKLLGNTEFVDIMKNMGGPALVGGMGKLEAAVRALSQFRPGGLDWTPVQGSFVPEGGAATPYFPDDMIAVLPTADELPDTLGMALGTAPIPVGPTFLGAELAHNGFVDSGRAPGMSEEMRGIYSYAEIVGAAPSVRIYAGAVFLPVLLNPIRLMRGSA